MSDYERPDIPVLAEPPLGRPRLKRLRLAFILFGLSLLALVSTAFGMMMAVASDLPQLENQTEFKPSQNSVLVDVRGQYLATLADQGRIIVPADDIALSMQHAIIAVEDERFYQNDGVDLRGIGRALFTDLTSRRAAQGGSTITQQFVKNATQAQNQRTVLEKIREAALAYHLTRKWSKKKILTEYLNSIYFGNGAYGIESAARTYFGSNAEHFGCGKPDNRCANELKPYEAALLAGMVASPSAYDPVVNREAAKRRRNVVLEKMVDQGYITQAEYQEGIQADVPDRETINPPKAQAASKSSAYFATWVRQQVIDKYGAREALLGRPARPDDDRPRHAAARRGCGHEAGSATRRAGRRPRSWRSTTRPARCARWSAAPTTTTSRSTSPPRASASRVRRSSRSCWRPRCAAGSRRARPGCPRSRSSRSPTASRSSP